MTRGHTEKAMSTLQRIASENGKPLPPGRLVEPSNKVSSEDYMLRHVIGGLFEFYSQKMSSKCLSQLLNEQHCQSDTH